ncbi:MAG: hypothetical protein J5602_11310 [Clostridia bacterium]|nr:hypothetical protein [Clostridia bacterium]MBO4885888.1 hypothetical protein [Clostridia bacterium]
MKVSSMAAVMVGAIAGASAATAFGMASRHTQRKLKKLARDAGRKMADGLNGLMG